jgi:dolichyl-phosphate beta-glucosyltransferase
VPERIKESSRIVTDEEWCTVVVPCYNEESRLRTICFTDFLRKNCNVRFLFVNDGSSDATLNILEGLKGQHPGLIFVLDKQPNAGKAEAVRSGMLLAISQGDTVYTGFWDADLATPLDEIPELLSKFKGEPRIEMVFGARVRLMGRAIHRKSARHYLGRVFATVVSRMLRLPIYDTQCGAKLFRVTPVLSQILAEPFQSRWIFDVEILARFLAAHKEDPAYVLEAIYECPLQSWEDVAGSKLGPMDFFKALGDLLKIRTTYLR